ncbi:MAG: DUF1905 domain-containing protein [Candidatus Dojkabacteria bacterium]
MNLGTLPEEEYKISGEVEVFPTTEEMAGGWYYLGLPKKYTKQFAPFAERGLVAASFTLGDTSWDSSLLPKGDGTLFIALSKKVRQAESVSEGDKVSISFRLRER